MENDGYLELEKGGAIARYNGRERLWTVERFNFRQMKIETG